MPACCERCHGDIDAHKVSQYFDRDMVVPWRCMVRELGPDVPRHIAMAEGLRFVYIGNVLDAQSGTTFCPNPQPPCWCLQRMAKVVERHFWM